MVSNVIRMLVWGTRANPVLDLQKQGFCEATVNGLKGIQTQ